MPNGCITCSTISNTSGGPYVIKNADGTETLVGFTTITNECAIVGQTVEPTPNQQNMVGGAGRTSVWNCECSFVTCRSVEPQCQLFDDGMPLAPFVYALSHSSGDMLNFTLFQPMRQTKWLVLSFMSVFFLLY
jgi:hypothetical protein